MSQRLRVHWLRIGEFTYAVVALFALTQGPVIRLWRPSEALLGSLPTPSIQQAHLATYLAAQLPAVVLWARRLDGSWFHERSNQALMVFLTWIGLGVTWSTFARVSVSEYLSLVMTTIFGLYLVSSFNLRQFWLVVTSAMALGVGFSWVAIMRLWDAAVNFQEDYWLGIYYNRNSLAPVAAVAILGTIGSVIGCLKVVRQRPILESIIIVGAAVSVAVVASIELWKSGSQTSPSALVIAAAVSGLWLLVVVLNKTQVSISLVKKYSVPTVLVVSSIVVFVAMRLEVGVAGVESQTTAFNQRSGLWALSWAAFLDKPWHGWGWMSAWRTPQFFLDNEQPAWMAWGLEWSHSGYFDVLLGGGVPAGIAFFLYLVFASQRLSTEPRHDVIPRLLLIAFVLAAATQESFFIGSHFLWALLVSGLAVKPSVYRSADQQHSH